MVLATFTLLHLQANLAEEAEAFLIEDAGLTADEVVTLKAKLGQ